MQALSTSDYPIKLGITIYDYNNGFNSIKIKKAKLDRIRLNVINLGIDFEDAYLGTVTNGTIQHITNICMEHRAYQV